MEWRTRRLLWGVNIWAEIWLMNHVKFWGSVPVLVNSILLRQTNSVLVCASPDTEKGFICWRNSKHLAESEVKRWRENTVEDKIRDMRGRGQILICYDWRVWILFRDSENILKNFLIIGLIYALERPLQYSENWVKCKWRYYEYERLITRLLLSWKRDDEDVLVLYPWSWGERVGWGFESTVDLNYWQGGCKVWEEHRNPKFWPEQNLANWYRQQLVHWSPHSPWWRFWFYLKSSRQQWSRKRKENSRHILI